MLQFYNARDHCMGFRDGYDRGYNDAAHGLSYSGLYGCSSIPSLRTRSEEYWQPVAVCLQSYRAGWRAGYAYGYDDAKLGCTPRELLRYNEHCFKLKVFGCDPTVREIEKRYDSTARLSAATLRNSSSSYAFLGS